MSNVVDSLRTEVARLRKRAAAMEMDRNVEKADRLCREDSCGFYVERMKQALKALRSPRGHSDRVQDAIDILHATLGERDDER